MDAAARRLVTRGAGAAWLALVLFLTLRPVGWIQHLPFWAFLPSLESGVDVVQNLVMFAPIGWIAHRGGWSARRTLAAAFAISAGIEFAQQWVPGRTSQAQDIVTNSLGALIGWWCATPPRRRNVRMAAAFVAFASFVGLHVLNTSWPEMAEGADGNGMWVGASRHACTPPASERTVCVIVPNIAPDGDKHLIVLGPKSLTYAHVQGLAFGRLMTRGDCVLMKFENTRGYWLRLRPPRTSACALADTGDRTIELRIDPRLEHETPGEWTPTRASVWMWPVWPFEAYRPTVLRAIGALTFVIVAALFAGEAVWLLPAGYLMLLELVAFSVGMRPLGWFDAAAALAAWMAARVAVALDRRWRYRSV